ncbi:MAG: hypothetical protein ACLQDV_02815 [Candidatus Binataceae bacterium]
MVGSASGPIFDELSSTYLIEKGRGTESADGFDVLIYDGESVTAEQIDTLPSTTNFLSAGKILIVLSPTPDDRQALDDHLGATALVDSSALAAFITYSDDGLLQTVDMVEFPATLAEDAAQTVPPGPASAAESDSTAPVPEPTDDETLRAHTDPSVARDLRADSNRGPASPRGTIGHFIRSICRGGGRRRHRYAIANYAGVRHRRHGHFGLAYTADRHHRGAG